MSIYSGCYQRRTNTRKKVRSRKASENIFLRCSIVALEEGKELQLKLVKDKVTDKCSTSLADRMTSESNKLVCYVSAFANGSGGHIYFGIELNESGSYVAYGQTVHDKEKIINKVNSTIDKLFVWPGIKGSLNKGQHWDIYFEVSNTEEAKYVIVISVNSHDRAVFAREPESYIVGANGKVQRMQFCEWAVRFLLADYRNIFLRELFPRIIGRCEWSSPEALKKHLDVLNILVILRNDGLKKEFNAYRDELLASSDGNTRCLLQQQEIARLFRKRLLDEAEAKLKENEDFLNETPAECADVGIYQTRRLYWTSVVKRAQGDYAKCCELCEEALQESHLQPTGLALPWLHYNQAKMVEIDIAKEEDASKERNLRTTAMGCYESALRSSVALQDFPEDLVVGVQQRVLIAMARLLLGAFYNGEHVVHKACLPCDIKHADYLLDVVKNSVDKQGLPMTSLSKAEYQLVRAEQYYNRWKESSKPVFIKGALKQCAKALERAETGNFKGVSYFAKGLIKILEKL